MTEQVVDAAEEPQQESDSRNMWSRPIEASEAINEEPETEVQPAEPANEPAQQPEESSEPPIQEQDSQPVQDEEPAEELDASEQQGEQEPAEEPADVPDKENPERFQYWQSKAQKTENELKQLKEQYGDVDEDYLNLAKNLKRDPKALEVLDSYLKGELIQQQAAPSNQQQDPEQALKQLQRPQRPEKPSNYDKVDAVSDPDSESYKYNQALIEYNEQLTEYNDTKERLKEQLHQQKQQQKQQQQQMQQRKQEIATELKKGYGFSEEEASDFFDFMENTEQNLDNYIKFYKALRQPEPKRQPQTKPKPATKDKHPPPAGVTNGARPKDAKRNMWGEAIG